MFNDCVVCKYKETWVDDLKKIVTFCTLREEIIPYGLCKICEKTKHEEKTKK